MKKKIWAVIIIITILICVIFFIFSNYSKETSSNTYTEIDQYPLTNTSSLEENDNLNITSISNKTGPVLPQQNVLTNTITNSYNPKKVNKTVNNVSVKIKEDTLTKVGCTIIITDTNEVACDYNNWYKIEQNINGEWKELKMLDGYKSTEEIISTTTGTLTFNIDWSGLYGELPNGKYKLTKRLYDDQGTQNIFVIFDI